MRPDPASTPILNRRPSTTRTPPAVGAARTKLTAALSVALLAACTNETLGRSYASIEFSPVTLNFGNQTAGASIGLPLSISNTGRLALKISGTQIVDDTRSAFSVSEIPTTIAAGASVTVTVTYLAPAAEGPDGARLVFNSNAQNALSAQVSLGGHSVILCGDGMTDCGGACLDTSGDDANCGQCGVSCAAPDHCVSSVCACVPTVCATGSCGDIDDGCGGMAHCGTCAGSDTACVSHMCLSCPSQAAFNACGICNGPTVPGVGGACTDLDDGCASTLACNAAGDGTVCTPVQKNACGVCGGPAVANLGNACMTTSGCPSTLVCDAGGDAVQCQDTPKNACGLCGGPALNNVGAACMDPSGCASIITCNAAGDGTACAPVTPNACGVCGGPAVAGLGSACMTSGNCASTLACNAAGDGTQCQNVAVNACGLCGGPLVNGVGGDCTGANGCTGKVICTVTQDGSTCDAPIVCDLADHVVISQISGYGPNGEYDEFIELYNPTASAVDLSAYTLWYRPASSTGNWSALGTVGGNIASHGYYLGVFGGSTASYAGTQAPDFSYSKTNLINIARTSGEIALWSTAGPPPAMPTLSSPGFVDFVGYGTAMDFDGAAPAPAPAVTNTSSIVRKATPASTAASEGPGGSDLTLGNGYDTDNNANDFVARASRTPNNASTLPVP